MSTPKKSAQLGRVSALIVLSACFAVSAVLRAGDVIAALPVGQDDGYGNPVVTPQVVDVVTAEDNATPVEPDQAEPSVLVAELRRVRSSLDERESELDAREEKLQTIEKRLRERLTEIEAARERLSRTAALVDDAAAKDVRRLAEMYEKMKPKQAGQIFNEMAPSFAAGFLGEMRPDVAALIMASMDADKAYAVSLLLAGRNVGREDRQKP